MSIEEIVEEEYTVEVTGVFHVYAESQEQANEYIENKLDKGDSGYTGSLEISGGLNDNN